MPNRTTKIDKMNNEQVISTNTPAEEPRKIKNLKYEVSCKIIGVNTNSEYGTRLFIQTDKEFESIDKDGHVIDTNSFGIAYGNLVNQIAAKVPLLGTIYNVCNRQVNLLMLNLLLAGSEVKIEREFKAEGESRSVSGIYSQDTFTTKILSCIVSLSQMNLSLISQALMQEASKSQQSVSKGLNLML